MSNGDRAPPFPLGLLLVDAIGGVALAIGAVGLVSGGSILPFLAERRFAWALVASGAALTVYTSLEIIRRLRERRGAAPR